MTSLLARCVRPSITLEILIVFGDSLPQSATAASRCAPAATAQSGVAGVMQNMFAARDAPGRVLFGSDDHPFGSSQMLDLRKIWRRHAGSKAGGRRAHGATR